MIASRQDTMTVARLEGSRSGFPLTPPLSPSDGERVSEGPVRGLGEE
jgi:hypothetical protein